MSIRIHLIGKTLTLKITQLPLISEQLNILFNSSAQNIQNNHIQQHTNHHGLIQSQIMDRINHSGTPLAFRQGLRSLHKLHIITEVDQVSDGLRGHHGLAVLRNPISHFRFIKPGFGLHQKFYNSKVSIRLLIEMESHLQMVVQIVFSFLFKFGTCLQPMGTPVTALPLLKQEQGRLSAEQVMVYWWSIIHLNWSWSLGLRSWKQSCSQDLGRLIEV